MLDSALIGACAVIRAKMVCCGYSLAVRPRGTSEYQPCTFLWRTGENYPRIIAKNSYLKVLFTPNIWTLSAPYHTYLEVEQHSLCMFIMLSKTKIIQIDSEKRDTVVASNTAKKQK